MKNKSKYLIYVLIGVVIIALIVISVKYFGNDSSESKKESKENTVIDNQEMDFLLDKYPIEQVPLYIMTKVSSSKLYNNWDLKNISVFDDKEFSYFNIVFYTQASQTEFLEYYKNLFDEEIVDEYPMPNMVKGNVDKYRVTAAHYGSDDTGYIQVYFPKNEVTKENTYFETFPNLFEEDSMFVEHENSYGLLNQSGGQIEYTKYFTVLDSGDSDGDSIDDVDEFAVLIAKYQGLYSSKDEYEFDNSTGRMSWVEDGYNVVVSFSRDHGRVYLNMRGSI